MSLYRPKSDAIFKKSCTLIPGGVNSPVRSFKTLGMTPLVAARGEGDIVVDIDHHSYIDFCCSWGALIHGHAHPEINQAAVERVKKSSSFGITTEGEVRLAEKIIQHMPQIEKMRFVSSGTEATMTALRLARGFTKKNLIVKFSGNYHGHSDCLLVQAGSGVAKLHASSSAGVSEELIASTISLPFNDIKAVESIFNERGLEIAAVIVEPIAANMGLVPSKPEFLQKLREMTSKTGALLILDEVISGFRVALGGATALYSINPDLICLGKVIGGGFPAAAVGGKAHIMDFLAPDGPVYQAGTLSGNPVAVEAGYTALQLCEKPGFYQTLEEKGAFLIGPIEKYIEEEGLEITVHRIGSLFTLFFGVNEINHFEDVKKCDPVAFKFFFKALFEKGVYFSPLQFEANFISIAHTQENLEYTSTVAIETLSKMAHKKIIRSSCAL